MKEITIVAYPYATQTGYIEVPEKLTGKELKQYIQEHFDEIVFERAQLDYAGTDFDVEEDD